MRALRLLGLGWLFHLKMLSQSAFDGLLGVLWPLFFATVAFFVFSAGAGGETLVYASFGAAVMGIWSATSTSAGSAMQRERWHGTLELLVAAPVHFALVLLPVTVAMSTIGLYSMTATLLWGRLAFGIDVPLAHPVAFAAALVATVLSIGALGFLLAVSFVRYRTAWALGNMLEYPVWLVGGFLVPLALLPVWVRPFSWMLAPTWGVDAVREAALGGSPLPEIGLCLALGGGYVAAGSLLLERVLRAARRRLARARMSGVRLFFVGGLISFRALFGFLRPSVYIPSLLVAPIFQILLFVYIGRAAGVQDDAFYVIGNAIQYAAVPCLFAMTFTIAGERYQHTLGYLLASPAPRLPLFLGRAVPVAVNGFLVAVFALVVGTLLVGIDIPSSAFGPLLLAMAASVLGCTGFGLVSAGIGLLLREQAVLANILFGLLLVFTGANVAVDSLPGWMQAVSGLLPFTHGIEGARRLAAGDSLGAVAGLLLTEIAIGAAYAVVGYAVIRLMERMSRRHATLERA